MNAQTQRVDVLDVLKQCDELFSKAGYSTWCVKEARAVVAELIEAAKSANATLCHAYHTALVGDLADNALADYRRLYAALAAIAGDASHG